MPESSSRIVLGIVGACLLLTLLVLFRSGSEEEVEPARPRPGSLTSQSAKSKAPSFARRDADGGWSSGDVDRPRDLPASGVEGRRPAAEGARGDNPAAPDEPVKLEAAGERNLAAEPVPAAPEGVGVLPIGSSGGPASPEALAAIPGAPQDAAMAVPFNGNGESLGAAVPLVEENVIYDLDEGAYFPPDARFAFADSGSVKNNAGTIGFWMKPNWDGSDPRNASLLQFRTEDWSNRLQIFKNGIYLRYLFTDNTGTETNLSVDMTREEPAWVAGDWHHMTITWGDSLITMYLDGTQRSQGTYFGDLEVPTGTELYLGSDRPGGNPGADATLQDFVVMDRVLPAAEVLDMFNQGRDS